MVEHFNSLSKLVLILEYDGRRYYGFQWQSGQPTIQASLEEAIYKATGEKRRVIAASRTDTGVHALYQVVSFRSASKLQPPILLKALNFYLPGDIAVKAAEYVFPDFNVRSDAISREYEYRIFSARARSPFLKDYAYHVPYEIELDVMNEACKTIIGEHDFTSFAASSCRARSYVRTIFEAEFKKIGPMLTFKIAANSFLTHQVRNTVGFLINLGSGKESIETLKHIMEQKKHGMGGPAAPAYGLYLTRVSYPKHLELKYENLFS